MTHYLAAKRDVKELLTGQGVGFGRGGVPYIYIYIYVVWNPYKKDPNRDPNLENYPYGLGS